MIVDKRMIEVIGDIEYLIGSECYNPNAYDGWTGEKGKLFRYPMHIPDENGQDTTIKWKLQASVMLDLDALTTASVEKMRYKFGSNELLIGRGIIAALDYLEKRYHLDFNELEKGLQD